MGFFAVAGLILFFLQSAIGAWFYFCFPKIGWKLPILLLPLCTGLFLNFALSYTRTHYGTWESILYFLAYTLAGLIFIFFFLVVSFAFLQGILALAHIPSRKFMIWLSMGMLVLTAALSVYGGLKNPQIKHLDIAIPQAPDMKIAVISDAHLGIGVSLRRFQKALDLIASQKPDAVLVLGDLFEYGPHREKYAQALARLQTKYGTFGVLGNHEYYTGLEKSLEFYRQANIYPLRNEIRMLPNGVQLIGVNDIATSRLLPQQLHMLLENTHPQRPRILLSHQPLYTDIAARHEIPLMISGHTHNGQIFPFQFFVKLKYPYVYGWYDLSAKSKIYVTSGMFYWGMPLRFFSSSEIPLIHLKAND
ncbi:MAG: metallophosphoesterase [Elusimicrobiaceae bacterium]|nr:metallophosphoesterase [Elusimicrobiaceae bacterium]